MREDSTTSPDPQEPKRGYADPNEQAKRAPESTGKVNAQGQREGVGENIAKHKQEIAQDRPAEGQDTAERKARNASRDIETADVNVQKMKMLFGEIGKEQQKPSPERAARDTELKAMQGTGKVNAMKTEIEQQQKSAKAQEVAPAKATTQQAAPKEKVQQAAPKEKSASQSQSTAKPSRLAKIGEGFKKAGKAMASGIKKVGTKIAALASRKKGGASKTTGDTGQKGASQQKGQESKGAPQQGQGEKKGIGERLKKAGKTAMKGVMVAALFVINPILALIAAIVLLATGKEKSQGGPTNQVLQEQESRGQSTGKQVQRSQAITAPTVELEKGVANPTQAPEKASQASPPKAPPLADKPITNGIADGQTQTPAKETKQQVTVPENAKQSIKDRANDLTKAMGQGEVGTRAPTQKPTTLPEQQKPTIGVSKFASEGIKAQAAALIQKSGGQFGKPSNVQGASAQTTGVGQVAATVKGRQ